MTRKQCRATCSEAYNHQLRMLDMGRRFASFLPEYRLLGVDPGYLFVPTQPDEDRPKQIDNRQSLDLPSDVVEHLLSQLEDD